jgi:hypothetical protein
MSTQTMPSETEIRANRVEDAEDARLRTDISLGRILGDTVRDQGADVFDLNASGRLRSGSTATTTSRHDASSS